MFQGQWRTLRVLNLLVMATFGISLYAGAQTIPAVPTPPIAIGELPIFNPGTGGGTGACVPIPDPNDPRCTGDPWFQGCSLNPCGSTIIGGGNMGGGSSFCQLNPTSPTCSGGYTPIYSPGGSPGYGGNQPTDLNGRPAIQSAYAMPAEYDCPLFDNRPHQELIVALDSLNAAMYSTASCQQQQTSWDSVQRNSEAIRTAMQSMQGLTQDPSILQSNPAAIANFERAITDAVSAANSIGAVFSNNSLLQSQCGREVMGSGKALLAINDILNGLAPFALMAVAMNPAMGMAMKFAITGGAMATSSISAVVKLINQGTVDMTNPDHRKALLKNTCQYTKIARKVRFMQLAQSGQIEKITAELETELAAYRSRYSSISPDLQQTLQQLTVVDQQLALVEKQIRKDLTDLLIFEAQLKEAEKDDLYSCLIAQEYVRRAEQQNASHLFPQSIFMNLDQVRTNTPGADQDVQIQSVLLLNQSARNRLRALHQGVLEDDGGAIKMCSDTARTWIRGLREALRLTSVLSNQERLAVEAELAQNPEYIAYRDQYRRVQQEQVTVTRVTRVMRELARENSVIDRSELDQRLASLKGALFGKTRGGLFAGKPPVEAWLVHTLSFQSQRISSFNDNIRRLQTASAQLTGQQAQAGTLDAITPTKIPLGTRGHELTCQLLESAWLDWAANIDHLGAAQFMCDMIDPYIDNKVDPDLVQFCRGQIALDGRQLRDSRLLEVRKALTRPYANSFSYKEWAQRVAGKMKEIQCPMPPVSVMN